MSPKLGKDAIISHLSFILSFLFFHLWPSSPLSGCLSVQAVKNSLSQTPWQHLILLWDADNEQAYEFSTMAPTLGDVKRQQKTQKREGEERMIIEIMAIKIQSCAFTFLKTCLVLFFQRSLFYCRGEALLCSSMAFLHNGWVNKNGFKMELQGLWIVENVNYLQWSHSWRKKREKRKS